MADRRYNDYEVFGYDVVRSQSNAEFDCIKDRDLLHYYVENLYKEEFWNPIYHAWYPFIKDWISRCIEVDYAQKYGIEYENAFKQITFIETEWNHYHHINGLFHGSVEFVPYLNIPYTSVLEDCNICRKILENRLDILKTVKSPEQFKYLFDFILQKEECECTCLMYFIHVLTYLKSFDSVLVEREIIDLVMDRLSQWKGVYFENLEQVQSMLVPENLINTMYSDIVINSIKDKWNSVFTADATKTISFEVTESLPPAIADRLVHYLCSLPFDSSYPDSRAKILGSLYSLVIKQCGNLDDTLNGFMLYTISPSRINSLCNRLYEFIELAESKDITKRLLDIYSCVPLNKARALDIPTAEIYLDKLTEMGYPEV